MVDQVAVQTPPPPPPRTPSSGSSTPGTFPRPPGPPPAPTPRPPPPAPSNVAGRVGIPRGASSISYSTPGQVARPARRSSSSLYLGSRRQLGPSVNTRFNLTPQVQGASASSSIVIDGVVMQINTTPNLQVHSRQLYKLFDKTDRHKMTPDQMAEFIDKATRPVLHKKGLPKMPPADPAGTEMLDTLTNNATAMDRIESQARVMDLMDGDTVVYPLDVHNSPALDPVRFSVFKDYAIITWEQMILSLTWYALWAGDSWVRESMELLKMLLRNNVDADLWNRCNEECLTAPPECQTGPLMLYLILRRLQNCSESTLELLLLKVRNYKIKDRQGEDIDYVVRMVNTAVALLKHSSNEDRNYIAHDFSRDLLRVFQTTSVPGFNQVFAEIERSKQVEADSSGSPVVPWPDLNSITQLALKTYHRMSATGVWAKGSRPPAFNATNSQWKPGSCFNCGDPDHISRDCTLPTNQPLFDANLKAYKEWKKTQGKTHGHSGRGSGRGGGGGRGNGSGSGRGTHGGRGGGRGKPFRKFASDGKPLKLNEHGLYVLDQARWNKQQKDATIEKLTAVLSTAGVGDSAIAALAGTPAPAPVAPPPAAPPAAPVAAPAAPTSDARTARLREALARCF